MATQNELGTVGSLWRYPVKSMMGEEMNATEVTEHGLSGDRAYALIDCTDGNVATAKNPRKWPHLFDFRSAFIDSPNVRGKTAPVCITLPDGMTITSEQGDCNQLLSRALAREVVLDAVSRRDEVAGSSASTARTAKAEEYWPDIEGLDFRDTVTDFALPAGTFFDCAVIHLLTTATLSRLQELYPRGRFEVRRFRPNIVVQTVSGERGFIEDTWVDQTLAIGEDVRLKITGPCGRCVMTTLPQGDLPSDPEILRTAAKHNHVQVGVYAAVVRGGMIHRGDSVRRTA